MVKGIHRIWMTKEKLQLRIGDRITWSEAMSFFSIAWPYVSLASWRQVLTVGTFWGGPAFLSHQIVSVKSPGSHV